MLARRLVLALTIGALVLAATPLPSWATFPGANGRIAFASNGAGDLDIYTMNQDGSGVTNVTSGPGSPAFALEPDWSPDATKIAFRSGRGDAAEIYTINADGTGATQLTNNSYKDYSPAWSPDGSQIAFASNRSDPNFATCISLFGCNDDIFVMPAAGGAAVQLTFDSGGDQFPQFSPDGNYVAYDSDAGGVFAIYKVDVGTLAVTKLTPDDVRAGEPDWSPDGTMITFTSNFYPCKKPKDCASNIFVMGASGASVTQLTFGIVNNLHPTWSPDGDKIVFSHYNCCGPSLKPEQIYTMNPDGTGLMRITRTNDDSFGPDWGSL